MAAVGAASQGIMAAGMAAVSGGLASGVGLAAAFVGGVVGSAASQVVGKAMGVVDHFSLRQAVSNGVATAAMAGIGGAMGGSGELVNSAGSVQWGNVGMTAVRGMAGYGVSYAAQKLTGQQAHFSWGGVAASAVGAVAGRGLAEGMGFDGNGFGDRWARSVLSSGATGAANRMLNKGGKVDWVRIATDAFANEIANELVGAMGPGAVSGEDRDAEVLNRAVDGIGQFGFFSSSGEADGAEHYTVTGRRVGAEEYLDSLSRYGDQARELRAANEALRMDEAGRHSQTLNADLEARKALAVNRRNLSAQRYNDAVERGQLMAMANEGRLDSNPVVLDPRAFAQQIEAPSFLESAWEVTKEYGAALGRGFAEFGLIADKLDRTAALADFSHGLVTQSPNQVVALSQAGLGSGADAAAIQAKQAYAAFQAGSFGHGEALGAVAIALEIGGSMALRSYNRGVAGNVVSIQAPQRGVTKRGTAEFQGLEVRAMRDLSHVDDGTLKAMQQYGFAAKDSKGNSLVLHHHKQNPAGPIIEMPAKNHRIGNARQHPLGNAKGVGLSQGERDSFNQWRVDYWKWRASQELSKRGY